MACVPEDLAKFDTNLLSKRGLRRGQQLPCAVKGIQVFSTVLLDDVSAPASGQHPVVFYVPNKTGKGMAEKIDAEIIDRGYQRVIVFSVSFSNHVDKCFSRDKCEYVDLVDLELVMFDRLLHKYSPVYDVQSEEQVRQLETRHKISRRQLPVVQSMHDPVCKVLGCRPGSTVKIRWTNEYRFVE